MIHGDVGCPGFDPGSAACIVPGWLAPKCTTTPTMMTIATDKTTITKPASSRLCSLFIYVSPINAAKSESIFPWLTGKLREGRGSPSRSFVNNF